jgi:hypothetical protein
MDWQNAAGVSLFRARRSLGDAIERLGGAVGSLDGAIGGLGDAIGRLGDTKHITRVKIRSLRDANGVPSVAKRRYEVRNSRS